MQTCQGSFRLHLAFIAWKSLAGMCATKHYIIKADELFAQTLQATYLHMDFGTVYVFIYPSPVGVSLIILLCFSLYGSDGRVV